MTNYTVDFKDGSTKDFEQSRDWTVFDFINLMGADLRGADFTGVALNGANLRGASLNGARLESTDLRNADLRGANLRGADLSSARIKGADFKGADLRGAKLTCIQAYSSDITTVRSLLTAKLDFEVLSIPELKGQIRAAISDTDIGEIEMSTWHKCATTHCLAGWAIHLAGQAGYELEKRLDSEAAGTLIFYKSIGAWPDFYSTNDEAIEWLNS